MLIVGLGNPGRKYVDTPHNLGYALADKIAEKISARFAKRKKCFSSVAEGAFDGARIVVAKPLTPMNSSGDAVRALMREYRVGPERLIACFDDFELPKFSSRARKAGGPGTHRGMKSIVEAIGTDRFARVRIGTGEPGSDIVGFVLSKMPRADRRKFDSELDALAESVLRYCATGDVDRFMRETNAKRD